jgi:predicted DNA-binding transcriptional regulator AlpA
MDNNSPEFLLTAELARRLRLTDRALLVWRKRGAGPRFIRLGPKRVVYARADVEAWLASRQEPQSVLPTAA